MTKQGASRPSRRTFLKATGAGVGLATLAGCSGGGGDGGGGDGGDGGGGDGGDGGSTGDGGSSMDTLTIAALEPQSGVFSVYGPRHLAGAQFAAQQINAAGDMDFEIQIESVDSQSDPQTAVTAFTRFIEQDGAVAGIGPVSSDAAIQTSNFAEDREVPILLHAAGASTILSMESRYTFRTALPAVPTVAKSIGNIIENEGYTEVAYVIEDGAWGHEFGAGVEAYWPDDINLTTATAPIPETDFIPYLRQFPDDVEVICGTAHPAGITSMYPQIQELGIELELYTAAITAMEVDYGAVGDAVGESFVSFNSPDLYSDTFAEVATAYAEETGNLFDTAQANGYVSVDLVAQAAAEAGAVDAQEISAALHEGTYSSLYANDIQYTEWGEVDGSINLYNGFDVGSAPDYYPDAPFAPTEFYRTEPLEPFEPGSLGLQ